MKTLCLSLLSYFCLALLCSAGQVTWGSSRFADNFTSLGPPNVLDSSFTFELGGFRNGFIPNSTNTAEWRLHWVTAQTSDYSSEAHFFTGSYVTPENEEPFRPSDQGYFWGYNHLSSQTDGSFGEWILITDPTWRWPAGGTVSPPVQWSVINATEAIVGSINEPSGEFHIQTASIPLPTSTVPSPSAWWTQHFPEETESEQGWAADPDGDGLPSLLEYALGTNPNQSKSDSLPQSQWVEIEGDLYWQLELDSVNLAAVVLNGEISNDLIEWSSDSTEIETVATSATGVIVRALYATEGRFFRLTARFTE